MAEIDKALTEIRKKVEIAGPEEQVEVQEEITESLPNPGDAEITPTEDGGVEIDFEPGAFNQAQSENHFDNSRVITRGNIRSSGFRIKSKLHGLQRVS